MSIRIKVNQLPPGELSPLAEPNILTWPKRIGKARIRVHCTIEGEPISKQRPRFSTAKNGRVYTPKQTRESEEWIGWQIKAAHRELLPDSDTAFGVRVLFYQSNQQRRDLDNMIKLVLDACTGLVWQDDSQVWEIIGHVFRGEETPKTELCVYSLGVLNYDTEVCLACGKLFRTYRSWRRQGKRYCSRACQSSASRSGQMKPCANCGTMVYRAPYRLRTGRNVYCSAECKAQHTTDELTCEDCGRVFRRPHSLNKAGRKFCSIECQVNFWRKHKAKTTQGVCSICGGTTSKRSYSKCRPCFISSKKFQSPGRKSTQLLEAPLTIIELREEEG